MNLNGGTYLWFMYVCCFCLTLQARVHYFGFCIEFWFFVQHVGALFSTRQFGSVEYAGAMPNMSKTQKYLEPCIRKGNKEEVKNDDWFRYQCLTFVVYWLDSDRSESTDRNLICDLNYTQLRFTFARKCLLNIGIGCVIEAYGSKWVIRMHMDTW